MPKTPRIPYEPVEDIPNLDRKKSSALKTDQAMRDLLNSSRFTLKHPSNLRQASNYKKPITEVLINELFMFSITHYSIREVVRAAERNNQYALMGDALSLAREQIEKVFITAALFDNPNGAFRQFLRSSWKNEYEKFLLESEEHKENERFREFLSSTIPKRLERMRRNSIIKGRNDVLVSKYAMRVLKFNWNNPGAMNPAWFKQTKKSSNVYNFVRNYFEFAAPGRSASRIKNEALRRFLYRWHKEYAALSQYTHVTMRKLAFADMIKTKNMAAQTRIREYGIECATRAIYTSYTAAASSCALVLNGVSNHYGAKAELKEFWEQLIGFSLFSKALWNIYIKELVG
jgi:hypothetical protein